MVKTKHSRLNSGSRSDKSTTRSGRRFNQIAAGREVELASSDSEMSETAPPSDFASAEAMVSLICDISNAPQLSTELPAKPIPTAISSLISNANDSWPSSRGMSLRQMVLGGNSAEGETVEEVNAVNLECNDAPVVYVHAVNVEGNSSNTNGTPGSIPVQSAFANMNRSNATQDCSQDVRRIAKPANTCWKTLFETLPNNAGTYEPIHFSIPDPDSGPAPPSEILNEAKSFWKDHVVGFFLDSKIPTFDMLEACRGAWRLHGQLRISLVNGMYYMKFSSIAEKHRVLEAAPAIIRGKPFIVTPWHASVDRARDQVLSIPVWAQFNNVPSALQPLIGLNWLVCLIGKLRCFDANTVARRNLVFARALIEVTPDKPLPTQLKVCIEEHFYYVDVSYKWNPEICSLCKSFGHVKEKCTASSDNIQTVKVPLPRPPPMIWVPKIKPVITPPLNVEVDKSTNKVPTDGQTFDWNKPERILTHSNSGMKHNLNKGTFYIHIDKEDATRKLIYRVEGEGLILATEGDDGMNNEQILLDNVWDRRHLYSESSPYFVSDLATHFTEATREVTPGDAVGG